ncbi:PREDICTED: uncharacterized protein LOC106811370 [Priapulus caudatus]|uniref:ATP-dependent DNA helicase n=1 Tax=Priapulus caudatus TaxID=37621 RepID=A0ABM1EE22_PRICU|nr:PREDICTED: uncharacterized protein LOC106811370 [Priapulus caudatus]
MYQGLMDHLALQATEHNLTPRKLVILPSSFQGSPRAMQQNFQDAMAIVSKHGRPDLFITFTCNPTCKDILDSLLPNQRPEHRPDIVSRVFKLHLAELLDDIRNKHVLGVPIAYIYVIEFQKRGLPHCHLLLILAEGSKLKEPADIDSVISAEIPDQQSEPHLYNIVKSTMVHGPCGSFNHASPYMVDNKCSKDYPKAFQDSTALAVNGYPLYRRRDNGRTIIVGRHEIDNRWIVPYNPYLTKKFYAHINVEACTSIKSVKYLFKYVYKGHDCANVRITQTDELTHDEVHTFLDTRYVSAPEAFWRLSEFHMHQQSHTVYRLAIHLPNQQHVYFEKGNHESAMLAASAHDTMLTAYFTINSRNPTPYLYTQLPNHFVWQNQTHQWTPRKQRGDKILPRIYSVSPKDTEKYCLRILLHHVTGATSFEHLRTIDDQVLPTFKEACIQRHLLTDDKEWDYALKEASRFQMPSQLRALFATICMYCLPTHASTLWDSHKVAMTEDYTDLHHLSPTAAEQKALLHIDSILRQASMKCSDFNLPLMDTQEIITNDTPQFNVSPQQAQELIAKLNDDQHSFVQAVIQDLHDIQTAATPKCRAYFLDGPGGTGKTLCYNTLISYCHSERQLVAATAWTGIAATLLTDGRTVHNLFKLPVPILDTSVSNVKPNSNHADFLRSVTLFIIDEASMIPSNALTAIDKMLRDIADIDIPFGGKIFVLGGDFRQVLPVIPKKPPAVVIENCLKRSPLWPHLTLHHLTKNMRALQSEQTFASWLLHLGNGQLHADTNIQNTIQIPPECNIVSQHTNIVDQIFSDLTQPRNLATTVILTPTNDSSLRINDSVIERLPGTPKLYTSADRAICVDEKEAQQYPLEFLNSITPTGMPPHRLLLKQESIVMLLRNLDVKRGLCNGTRLLVRHLHNHVIDAEIITGSSKGQLVLIPRIKLAPSDANLPFILERTQFPIRASYCMTINKAQGQTFNKVGIFLPQSVFSHGQLYVAFSRARRFQDIFVQVLQSPTQGVFNNKTVTNNIVYKEVL